MSRKRRLLVAVLTTIALFSVVVLSAGLSALRPSSPRAVVLPRGTPSGDPGADDTAGAVETHAETLPSRTLLPFILLGLALVVVAIFLVVTPEGRRLLVYAVLLLLFLAFFMLLRGAPSSLSQATPTPAQEAEETPAEVPAPLSFEPPPWLILGASLAVALLLIGAVALSASRLRRRPAGPAFPSPLPELAEEARQALADLQAGRDLRDTIIRCYDEICRTLRDYRGIERWPAMTPQEFARGLAATNLPQADVWRITRLFERVRYSSHLPGPEDEAEAKVCLAAIVQAAYAEPPAGAGGSDDERAGELTRSMSHR